MGKKGIWIKLPIHHSQLVESVVKEGFRYQHAESDYLVLVRWISDSPANASHRVLVVQESTGKFKGTGVWKLPTGVVNEGEDICTAAIREAKEEAGWIPIKEYASQPSVLKKEQFRDVARICETKAANAYIGFTPFATKNWFWENQKNLDLN